MGANMAFFFICLLLVMSESTMVVALTPQNLFNEAYVGEENLVPLRVGAYQETCPDAEAIVLSWVEKAVFEDPRMAASLLRLHFHDCFLICLLQGCDASVLLDDTVNFVGEKTAGPNFNSLRGFEVIDSIKFDLEMACPQTVSCADILAIAARDSVYLSGGPSWEVQLGRRDSLTASKTEANNNIPAPNSTVSILLTKFEAVGLSLADMVALSGAHTIGKARCSTFSARFDSKRGSNAPEMNMEFLESLEYLCSESNTTLAHLDLVTPTRFDNQYYVNLMNGKGLLFSDQVLMIGDERTRQIVQTYVDNLDIFFEDFKISMLRMGRLNPLTGNKGEIRRICRSIN
ncbi:hem peroxidase [Dillenia turbinata]|uniref:Peroxidase n=1 Tax=Dillenia turbinata TaxID=194707 RepID=A0AAN8VEN5_9MAGN